MKLPLWMRIVMWSLRAVELPPDPPALPPPGNHRPAGLPAAELYASPWEPLFQIRGHADVAALGCLFGAPLRRGQA